MEVRRCWGRHPSAFKRESRLGARMCVVTKPPKVTATSAALGTTDDRATVGHACFPPAGQGLWPVGTEPALGSGSYTELPTATGWWHGAKRLPAHSRGAQGRPH